MPYYDTVTHVFEKKLVLPLGTWRAIRYGTANAGSRKYIGVFNRSPYTIYITTDNTADPAHTRAVRQGGERIMPYSDKVTLYRMSAETGGATRVVTEECG